MAQIEDDLADYAESLVPTASEVAWCKREVDQLVQVLSTEGRSFGVQRLRVGGGLEKGTCVKGLLDADVVAYVESEPPFSKAARLLHNITAEHYRWRQGESVCVQMDRTKTCTFNLDGRADFTLFVGRDMVKKEERKMQPAALDLRQYRRTLQWLRQFVSEPLKLQISSAHLAPANVQFVMEQVHDEQVLDLVRLCRKWSASVCGLPTVRARSAAVELVAVAAAHQDRTNTLLNSFRRFLQSWRDMHAGLYCHRFAYPLERELYRSQDIPACVRDDRPLLVDPADPFNNKLKPFIDCNAIAAFSACAAVSLHRLDVAEQKDFLLGDRFFAPQNVAELDADKFSYANGDSRKFVPQKSHR